MVKNVHFLLGLGLGLLFSIFSFPCSLHAQNKVQKLFLCPVCQFKVAGFLVLKEGSEKGQDLDFLPRISGDSFLEFRPITCPRCLYTEEGKSFENIVSKEVRDFTLTQRLSLPPELETPLLESIQKTLKKEEELDRLLEELKPFQDEIPQKEKERLTEMRLEYEQIRNTLIIPTHLRYYLLAKQYEHQGRSPLILAFQYLSASWVVRLDSNPLKNLEEERKKEIRDFLKKTWSPPKGENLNSSIYTLEQGRSWAKDLEQHLEPTQERLTAFVALYFLRTYGEHTEVLDILARYPQAFSNDPNFQEGLEKSIALERFFQQKALNFFEKSLVQHPQNPTFLYLCAELARRLEQGDSAKKYYQKALDFASPQTPIHQYSTEQLQRLLHR